MNLKQPVFILSFFGNVNQHYLPVQTVCFKHISRLDKYHDWSACIKRDLSVHGVRKLLFDLVKIQHQVWEIQADVSLD